MSFTDKVKHELTRIESSSLAELSALLKMDGSIQISNKKLAVKIKLYQGELARRVFSLIKNNFDLQIEIIVREVNHFKYNRIYELILKSQPGIKNFLIKLGFLDNNNNIEYNVKNEFIENEQARKEYLRGVFMGGGSINDPHGEYHLEIRCEYESHAKDIMKILKKFDLNGHLNQHNSKYVVYLKSFDEIAAFLNIIGASNSQLKMEEIHLLKEVKNDVNRKVNAETANLDKTVAAAMEQLEKIKIIENEKGLDFLSSSLREIAIIRKQNPYASLKELGEMLEPTLTKSGVNHRMRRLRNIADELME